MKAKIEKIEEKTTEKGNSYVVVTLGGKKYALFNPRDCVNVIGWGVGAIVEIETEKNGKWENITRIDIFEKPAEKLWENKDKKIIRQNALTQANNLVSTLQAGDRLKDMTNEQIRELLFIVAEECEEWVYR